MRTIRQLGAFKKDLKREKKGRHRAYLAASVAEVVTLLADDQPLPQRYVDHALSGYWADHRDCHIRPDLILIYRKPDDDYLDLVRLGSHAELGM